MGIVGTLEKLAGKSPVLAAAAYGIVGWKFLHLLPYDAIASVAGAAAGAALAVLPALGTPRPASQKARKTIIVGALVGAAIPLAGVGYSVVKTFQMAKLFSRREAPLGSAPPSQPKS